MRALDLFAGTGWGVACQRLGIEEHGVELMPEAVAVREANGMHTAFCDVWDGLDGHEAVPEHDLLIASPPCQTFSMAGGGAGRRALDEVLGLVESRAFADPAALRAFGERHDPRTSLVLAPMAYVAAHTPRLVVFEQVPTVKPVWEACAEVLRSWGYSAATAVLSAEQYGVPQTRKRAILVARWDGEARMPTPTHSRYYSHDRERLDEGVAPWVSMAEALGRSFGVRMRSNYGTDGDASKRGERTGDEPAPTMTSKADRNLWLTANDRLSNAAKRHIDEPAPTVTGGHDSGNRKWVGNPESVRVTVEEAATLQSYPEGFKWRGVWYEDPKTQKRKPVAQGKLFLQVGNAVPPLLAEAILREVTAQG